MMGVMTVRLSPLPRNRALCPASAEDSGQSTNAVPSCAALAPIFSDLCDVGAVHDSAGGNHGERQFADERSCERRYV